MRDSDEFVRAVRRGWGQTVRPTLGDRLRWALGHYALGLAAIVDMLRGR